MPTYEVTMTWLKRKPWKAAQIEKIAERTGCAVGTDFRISTLQHEDADTPLSAASTALAETADVIPDSVVCVSLSVDLCGCPPDEMTS